MIRYFNRNLKTFKRLFSIHWLIIDSFSDSHFESIFPLDLESRPFEHLESIDLRIIKIFLSFTNNARN